jgi:hypothetical protein
MTEFACRRLSDRLTTCGHQEEELIMTSHAEHPDHGSMRASDVRFFWVKDGGAHEDHTYHWCVDCEWLAVALWHGGRLVSSEAPPPGAADTALARETLAEHLQGPAWNPGVVDSPTDETKQERWLCWVCSQYYPRTEAEPWSAETEPCEKCGCGRELHTWLRGPCDRGCGMTWPDIDLDADGQVLGSALIHCPCDGYVPPAGGRPVTLSELFADGSTSGGGRTWVS